MIRKLQRPRVDRRLRAFHDRLEERREEKSEKQQVKERPLPQGQTENGQHSGEESHDRPRREILDQFAPIKIGELTPQFERRDPLGILRLGRLLRCRSHALAQRANNQIGKAARVLRAVDRIEKSLRRARVAPVHRRIGGRRDGHVGIRKQSGDDDQRDQEDNFEIGAPPFEHEEDDQPEHGKIEKPHRGRPSRGVLREPRKTEIDQRRTDNRGHQHFPEHRTAHEQRHEERQRREREREVVIAHAQREAEECGENRPVELGAPNPPVKRKQEESDEQPVQRVNLGNDRLRPKRKTESEEQSEADRDQAGDERGHFGGSVIRAPPGHHPTQHRRGEQRGGPDRERTA